MLIRILNLPDEPPGNNIRVLSDSGSEEIDFIHECPNGETVMYRMSRHDIMAVPDPPADWKELIILPTLHLRHHGNWAWTPRTLRAIKLLMD